MSNSSSSNPRPPKDPSIVRPSLKKRRSKSINDPVSPFSSTQHSNDQGDNSNHKVTSASNVQHNESNDELCRMEGEKAKPKSYEEQIMDALIEDFNKDNIIVQGKIIAIREIIEQEDIDQHPPSQLSKLFAFSLPIIFISLALWLLDPNRAGSIIFSPIIHLILFMTFLLLFKYHLVAIHPEVRISDKTFRPPQSTPCSFLTNVFVTAVILFALSISAIIVQWTLKVFDPLVYFIAAVSCLFEVILTLCSLLLYQMC